MILETESISVSNTNDSKIFLVTYNGGELLENKAWFPVMKLNDKKKSNESEVTKIETLFVKLAIWREICTFPQFYLVNQ